MICLYLWDTICERSYILSSKEYIYDNDKIVLYHELSFGNEIQDFFIEFIDPKNFSVKRESDGSPSVCIGLPAESMDALAIAWIKKRDLGGAFGAPVGKEFGSPDCDYS